MSDWLEIPKLTLTSRGMEGRTLCTIYPRNEDGRSPERGYFHRSVVYVVAISNTVYVAIKPLSISTSGDGSVLAEFENWALDLIILGDVRGTGASIDYRRIWGGEPSEGQIQARIKELVTSITNGELHHGETAMVYTPTKEKYRAGAPCCSLQAYFNTYGEKVIVPSPAGRAIKPPKNFVPEAPIEKIAPVYHDWAGDW